MSSIKPNECNYLGYSIPRKMPECNTPVNNPIYQAPSFDKKLSLFDALHIVDVGAISNKKFVSVPYYTKSDSGYVVCENGVISPKN